MIRTLFVQIPELRTISDETKEKIILIAAAQLSILRGTFKKLTAKYTTSPLGSPMGSSGSSSPSSSDNDDIWTSNGANGNKDDASMSSMAMGDRPLSVEKLKKIGLSNELVESITEISKSLKLKQKPCLIEWSLMSGLCLFNNDVAYEATIDENERKVIERIQVRNDRLSILECHGRVWARVWKLGIFVVGKCSGKTR